MFLDVLNLNLVYVSVLYKRDKIFENVEFFHRLLWMKFYFSYLRLEILPKVIVVPYSFAEF